MFRITAHIGCFGILHCAQERGQIRNCASVRVQLRQCLPQLRGDASGEHSHQALSGVAQQLALPRAADPWAGCAVSQVERVDAQAQAPFQGLDWVAHLRARQPQSPVICDGVHQLGKNIGATAYAHGDSINIFSGLLAQLVGVQRDLMIDHTMCSPAVAAGGVYKHPCEAQLNPRQSLAAVLFQERCVGSVLAALLRRSALGPHDRASKCQRCHRLALCGFPPRPTRWVQ